MSKTNKTCAYCKNEFQTYHKNLQCCSRRCKADFQKSKSGAIRKCIHCNKDFYAKGNPSGRIFCSRACSAKNKEKGIYAKCETCGSIIYVYKYRMKKQKKHFCSMACANIGQTKDKIKLICVTCKKEFETHPCNIKRKYCSNKCCYADPQIKERLRSMNSMQSKTQHRNKLEITGRTILEELQIKFTEQELINNKILVDVFVPSKNLIIEWWGDYWHGHSSKIKGSPDKRQAKRMALDKSQRKYFEKCGFKFLSFWEHELYKTKDKVINKIKETLCQIP
jgi:very-short-patch-repair endonuclease